MKMMKTAVFACLMAAYAGILRGDSLDLQYSIGLQQATVEFTRLQTQMEALVGLLEQGGLESLRKASPSLLDSAFVLDPSSGRVLLSGGREAGDYFHINGRSVARATIRHWQDNRDGNLLEQIVDRSSHPYRMLYSDLAITQEGQLFVVAVGRENLDLEKLFIRRLIEKACSTIQGQGLEKALALFDDPSGDFRSEYTYVFVYEGDRCLFNPNYPELVGKTPPEMEPGIRAVVSDFLALSQRQGEGWLTVRVRNPITKTSDEKDLYIKRLILGGRTYTVGSGIYEGMDEPRPEDGTK